MTRIKVEAKPDHLDRLVSSPRVGLLELIWNALDADATEVRADITDNGLGGALAVTVTDNGRGISADRAAKEFGALGGSWKRAATVTDAGRALHGKLGGGRFAAYGLGNDVRWESVSDATTGRRLTVINGSHSLPDEFDVVTEKSEASATGTVVSVTDLTPQARKYLDSDRVADGLISALAVYLLKYKPRITWRERVLEPEALISQRTTIDVPVPTLGADTTVPVTIIEWNTNVDRALHLCNASGIAIQEVPPGIQAPGFTFTAYVNWDGFADRPHDLLIEGAADEPVRSVVEAARDALRAHFKSRTDERHTRMLEKWKKEQSYPFEGEATKPAERATRELFDIVAVAAAPAVEKVDPTSRKFSLRLLKEAVETNPGSVDALLREVLKLSDQDAADLRELAQKSSLSKLISSARKITDRLEFLASLEAIVNEPDLKKVVKERSQLHRILANETWVFREEYALVGDDQTLRTVLRNNLGQLGGEVVTVEDVESAEVVDGDGRVGVIDLMLSKVVEQRRDHREHLVIELKRPSVHIGRDEINQIEAYAEAVANDTRFAATDTRWEFWIVGDKIADSSRGRTNQSGREPGVTLATDNPNMVVRAVTWAQVIRDAKHRLQFVRESLDYDPSTEAGLDYLRRKHAEYLPPLLIEGPEDLEGEGEAA
ncbi:ATP-binding protein [Agromyces indicus]|uniref:ATP-binding protein n=1 Tax=Agromyces indicus TaxID=758919 RepID=A0ABU1FFP0_9MICO|nr:ATP-binding protein [Agromyces indicus]MDR5690564.1 ATP-binding protein [Agromyces indicus]